MTTDSMGEALAGCLLGVAVGDATGLCCEGLSRLRQAALFPRLDGLRLFGRQGMVSDDTDHARMTVQALADCGDDIARFTDALSREVRRWILSFPPGVGLATLRAGIKLIAGADARTSGVFSAGNGPAMRAPVIGVAWGEDGEAMCRFVRASTRLTHTDPKAEWGAQAVALAAALSCGTPGEVRPADYQAAIAKLLPREAAELLALMGRAVLSAAAGASTAEFCAANGMGRGIGGYIYHTVPAVIQTWLRHQTDIRSGVLEIVRCGGDTDTTAAILGGIIGARVGPAGIPADWLARIFDPAYPPSTLVALAHGLAEALCYGTRGRLPRSNALTVFGRNSLLLAVVLAHGVRRLAPPYAGRHPLESH